MGTTLQKTLDENPSLATEEVVEIDIAEFQAAQRDPRVHGFLTEARAYGERLRSEGRNHR